MNETFVVSGRPPKKSEETVITTGLTDAQLRASAVSVSSALYDLQYEEASSTITYIGEAAIGSATSASAWRIKRMNTASGIVITWADDTSAFTKVWDSRASYSY